MMQVHLAIGSDDRHVERFTKGDDESLVVFADRIDSVLRARLGLLDGENHSFVMRQIADARAAGYAEAIEKAAKVAKAEWDRLYRSHRDDDLPGMDAARAIEDAIRGLAPATTKEPT